MDPVGATPLQDDVDQSFPFLKGAEPRPHTSRLYVVYSALIFTYP